MNTAIRGKRIVIVGMGQTAVSLARLVLNEGGIPFVTESTDSVSLSAHRVALESMHVAFECGGHSDAAFNTADWVVPSPGVSPEIPAVARSREWGIPVISEMEFTWPCCRSKVLAVTGTNGKTTTTELLRAMIAATGASVVLAGNNALPFSSAVLIEPAPEYIVLEVSSYQLELTATFRPWTACVLNLTPDHLARHKTMQEYAACKARIFANQHEGDIAVVNADDPVVVGMTAGCSAQRFAFSRRNRVEPGLWIEGHDIRSGDECVASVLDSPLRGKHNLENVLAALTMCRAGGFDWPRVRDGLRTFRGVEHRIEFVRELDGVKYFNDSKSTNIDSLRVALESFDEPIVLIAGGRGKGSDYRVLSALMAAHVRHLIVFGEDAGRIEEAFGGIVPVTSTKKLMEAVEASRSAAQAGDVVLLSPACASFDQFDNFEHRGRAFKDMVMNLKEHVQI